MVITLVLVVALVTAMGVGLIALNSGYLVSDRGKIGLPRLLREKEIRTDTVPGLLGAMSRGTASVRYAALILYTPDRPSEDDAVNLQISFENGKAGFDWVLLAPRNLEDQEVFKAFAHAHGVEPIARSENGVSYLRVECADVAKFTSSVITEMYHRPPDERLGLVYEGFAWP